MAEWKETEEHLMNGGKARRSNWVDPDAYVYYRETGAELDGTPYGCFYAREPLKNPEGNQKYDVAFYGFRHRDLGVTDWILLE